MNNNLLSLLLKNAMQLSDDQIDHIREGMSIEDAYQEGKFCSHCPAFDRGCNNTPAQKAKQRLGLPAENPRRKVLEMLVALKALQKILDEIKASESTNKPTEPKQPPAATGVPKVELPEEFQKFFDERNFK